MAIHVNVDNFARAETDRMFHDLQHNAGGINTFVHEREPAAVERQAVIRLNRDTLYSFAVVDLNQDATLTIPEHGERYVSVMVVNEDHFVNDTLHDAGTYTLTAEQFGTRYVAVAVRVLVDPADADDLAQVQALQDRFLLSAESSTAFVQPDYDVESFDATREALLALAAGLSSFDRTFGRADQVDKVRHLIGTAAGWGGLPSDEASYVGVVPDATGGNCELTMRDVPVDGFWSISVYNEAGFFEPNDRGAYSINNITGVSNPDGSVTVRFGTFPEETPNTIPTPEGWNYLIRLYRPHQEILDGTWTPPAVTAAAAPSH